MTGFQDAPLRKIETCRKVPGYGVRYATLECGHEVRLFLPPSKIPKRTRCQECWKERAEAAKKEESC
jgi:hypothetical protein